jgi:hypothetical protein
VRKRIGAMNMARTQMVAKVSPGFEPRVAFSGSLRNVKQHGFASLLFRQVVQAFGIYSRGGKQLRGCTEAVQVVWMFVQAKANADFFIGEIPRIGRERGIKITLIMFRATFDGDLQQPFRQALIRSAFPRQSKRETGDMCDVAESAGERR